ncbi:DUF2062 domain-containing protein [Deefgea piscis]|uniref:DUF2062 domain-containing protein n=1 Tax=Deefgea piscis TaxID=2739061 RepID=UPI001C804F27|nr:DUF2062 domain-containing protein [Deefgea piscis]QZA80632.1 DUF2062 domain-containing protein [Deefgea piscis]
MPRKYLRRWLPDHAAMLDNRFLRRFAHWFEHPNLFHLNRKSVAGGLAVGMIGGLIPGPLQVITSAILCLIFRVNLPVAILGTFYTNPLTIAPIYWLAYQIGAWVSNAQGRAVLAPMPEWGELSLNGWLLAMWHWVGTLGTPLLIGLPILAFGLAIVMYFAVQLLWRLWVYWMLHQKRKRR